MQKLEFIEISKIKPWAKNRNKHTKDQIERLCKIIEYQGFRNPILVDRATNEITAGCGRYMAAKKLNLKKVPVVFQDYTSEEQKYAHMVSDNAIASWSELQLDDIKIDISDFKLDLDLLGIEDFMEDKPKEGLTDEDAVPDIEKNKFGVIEGQIWQLGKHRLMCGDSTNKNHVELLMNGQKADMVFTDPPYNTGMGEKNKGSTWLNHMFNDSFGENEWEQFMQNFCYLYNHIVMKDDCVAYICLDWRRNHELIPHIKKNFKLSNVIIWDKVVHGLGSDYKYTYEIINVCKKGKPVLDTHQGMDAEYSDVWHIQRKMGKDKDHATKKPIELVDRCLRHASKSNQLVTDLFLGSGSTLIACEKTNRKCYGMELDPHYCSVIIQRWQDFTGQSAKLLYS